MKHLKTITVLLFALLVPFCSWAVEYTVTPIPNSQGGMNSRIDNGQIVWECWDGNTNQIFFYDTVKGIEPIQLSNGSYYSYDPSISNGQVVWQGYDGTNWQIFFYDTVKGTGPIQLTNNSYGSFFPSISNGQIVWSGWGAEGGWQIFFYDIAKGAGLIQLTNNSYDSFGPSINNGRVVWQGRVSDVGTGLIQIFFYDTAIGGKPLQLSNNTGEGGWNYSCSGLSISNGQVVWQGQDANGDGQIFFYDTVKGIGPTQLTNDSFGDYLYNNWPSISNGQVVWDRGHYPYQVFFYDIAKGIGPIQLTNDGYGGYSPSISNGQIVWDGVDANGVNQIYLATPKTGVELLDGVDFSAGTDVSNDPDRLIGPGTSVDGAVCDGVTRLLLRAKLSSPGQVTFSFDQNANINETGTLRSILASDNQGGNPQNGNTVTVNSVTASDGKEYAFAVYQAPDNFVRQNHSEDLTTSERVVTLNVNAAGNAITQTIKLDRPPVVLVHGLWSSSAMWTGGDNGDGYDFRTQMAANLEKIRIFKPDYKNTNAASFATNKEVVKKAIADARTDLKSHGYAMVQADVVAHSMGGLLARQWTEQGDFVYDRDENYWTGDIHKLITLDAPHKGSFLANAGIACSKGPHSLQTTNILFFMNIFGHPVNQGAVEDLMTNSKAIVNINANPTRAPVHAIIGHYTDYSVQSYVNPDGTIWRQLSGLPGAYHDLQNILESDANAYNRPDYQTVSYIINGSDLVVSNDSQQGGLNLPTYYTWGHDHMNTTTADVLGEVVGLLNASKDSNVFSKEL